MQSEHGPLAKDLIFAGIKIQRTMSEYVPLQFLSPILIRLLFVQMRTTTERTRRVRARQLSIDMVQLS